MKIIKKLYYRFPIVLVLAVVALFSFYGSSYSVNREKMSKQTFKAYIEKNGEEPMHYVLDKFKKYDLVLLGELGNFKQNIEFVKNSLSILYNNGIYTLAIEYGNAEDQAKMDKLIFDENFDKDLAYDILRNYREYGIWGYKEYIDLYRTAWELNRHVSGNAPKFRIVFLGSTAYSPDDKYFKNESRNEKCKFASEIMKKNLGEKRNKAIVLMSLDKISKFSSSLKNSYTLRVFSIQFHSPLTVIDIRTSKIKELVKPAHGELDAAIDMLNNNAVAFNITNSPLTESSDKKNEAQNLKNEIIYNMDCDGYLYLKPYKQFERLTWLPDFITNEYFQSVKNYYKALNPDLRIETIDYANDLSSASDWFLFEMIRNLGSLGYSLFGEATSE